MPMPRFIFPEILTYLGTKIMLKSLAINRRSRVAPPQVESRKKLPSEHRHLSFFPYL